MDLGEDVRRRRLTVGDSAAFARRLTAAVLAGFLINAVVNVGLAEGIGWGLVVAAGAGLAVFAVQVEVISNPARDPRGSGGMVALLIEVVVVGLATARFGYLWLGLAGFVAGSALIVVRGNARWLVFGLVGAVVAVVAGQLGEPLLGQGYALVATVGTSLIVFGLARLHQLAVELDETRSEAAGLAAVQERLRLADDLQETIGHRLSGVALRVALARRLLARVPDRAGREVATAVELSRQALDEVRATARRHRRVSLRSEVAAARGTLSSAGVATVARTPGGTDLDTLPTEIATVFAGVLRSEVDDMSMSPGVRRCELIVDRVDRSVVLEVVREGGECSAVVDDMVAQVAAAGGTMVRTAGTGGQRTRVVMPAPSEALAVRDPVEPRPPGIPMIRGLAQTLMVAVLAGYAVNSLLLILLGQPTPFTVATGVVLIATMLAVQLGVLGRPTSADRPTRLRLALVVQVVLAVASILLLADPYAGIPGFVAGSAVLVLPRIAGWALFVAVVVAVGGAQLLLSGTGDAVVYGVVATFNHGLVVFGLTRFRSLVEDLEEARADSATVAVTRERLQFARDLHDLLGYGLSAVTLKCELAVRLLEVDRARADAELAEVLSVAARAQVDLRSVGGGTHRLELAAELESVGSVLESAGIDMRLVGSVDEVATADLPPDVATVLATVLREAVTNLLRHSDARVCSIRWCSDPIAVEITNDGASMSGSTPGGSGLSSLAQRAASIGGVLTAGPTAHAGFSVCITVPTRAPVAATAAS